MVKDVIIDITCTHDEYSGSTGTGVVNHPLFVNYSLFYRWLCQY